MGKLKRWLSQALVAVLVWSVIVPAQAAPPIWMTAPDQYATPALSLNFLSGSLDSRVTFTRASAATYFNSSGTLTSASSNTARFDYNPSTLAARGLLIEESRTNSIRNNTMVGASAGTPGTLPTNWATFTVLTGLTRTIVGTGTENGIAYIDIRLSGTPSAAGSYYLQFESNTQVAASNGQAWTSSSYFKLVAGSLTGITLTLVTSQRDGVGGDLGGVSTAFTPSSAGLSTQRIQSTLTNNSASTAFELPYIQFALSGAAIDITLRIGLPQLELGAFATSVIQTTNAAVTRAADLASMTGSNFSSWYNQTQGTFVVSAISNGTTASGSKTVISANTGGYNDSVDVYVTSAWRGDSVVGGVNQSSGTNNLGAFSAGSMAKIAYSYQANNFAGVLNAGTVSTDTSGSLPTVGTLEIGTTASFGALNGWIQSIAYYPFRMRDTTIKVLSASIASDTMYAANDDYFFKIAMGAN